LRFCFLTTFYPPWNFGGDGVQIQRLAHALAARGHDVTVVHSQEGYRASGGSDHPPSDRDGPVRLVPIDAGLGRLSPLATYLTGRPLLVEGQLRRILAERFDVLHFHNPSLLGGPGVLALGDGLKLYTAHEHWLVCPMHVLWQDQRRVCVEPHCARCTLRHGRPPQLWRGSGVLERGLAHLDALIALSETSARLHERLASSIPISVLPHFVPDPGPPPSPRADVARGPFVLFAGRLEPIKGPMSMLPAFGPGAAARLVVAGSGSLEGAMRRAAAARERVEFTGWLGSDELAALQRDALAVVVPSAGHETFGLAAVEAMAHGVPAVVRDFGALGELARSSDAVIGYRTADELRAVIGRLAAEPAWRAQLGGIARADFLRRWTEATHLRDYFTLIGDSARATGRIELAELAAHEVGGAAAPS
jgi:glycosyltransferase involved in cell wall biosynthesis